MLVYNWPAGSKVLLLGNWVDDKYKVVAGFRAKLDWLVSCAFHMENGETGEINLRP